MSIVLNAYTASAIAAGMVSGLKIGGGAGLALSLKLDDFSFVALGLVTGAVAGGVVASNTLEKPFPVLERADSVVRKLERKVENLVRAPLQVKANAGRLTLVVPPRALTL